MKLNHITLRTAQIKAIEELRANWNKYKTFCIKLPTGTGKTILSAFIIDALIKHSLRVGFIVPYTVLINQTHSAFLSTGLPEEELSVMWQKDERFNIDKKIQIASADTLIRRDIEQLSLDVIFIDEAHLSRAKLNNFIKNSNVKVIGLTATPYSKGMGNVYQHLINPVSLQELTNDGTLCKAVYYAPSKPDLSKLKTKATSYGMDYSDSDVEAIMNGADIVADVVQNWLENGQNRKTICFACSVLHANHITQQFLKAGVAAEVVTANTPKEERQRMFNRFRGGITRILVNVGVLTAGFDVPETSCIIYTRSTKSEARFVQAVGRGLRSVDGKEDCLIFDHSSTTMRLGTLIDIDNSFVDLDYTDKKAKSSERKEKEKKEKLPWECPECKRVNSGHEIACECGYTRIATKNVEVDTSRDLVQMTEVKKKDRKNMTFLEKEIVFRSFLGYAFEKGYKTGWAVFKYRDYFGESPEKGFKWEPVEPIPMIRNWLKGQFLRMKYARAKYENNRAY